MKAVTDENTPISRAAKDYSVPVSTLHDRISGKVYGDKPGPSHCCQLLKKRICHLFGGSFPSWVWKDKKGSTEYCRESGHRQRGEG